MYHSIYAQQGLVAASVAVLSLSLALSLGEGLRVGGWNLSYLRNDLCLGLGADIGVGDSVDDGLVCRANGTAYSQTDINSILAKVTYVVFDDSTLIEVLTSSFTLVL